jgi:hypothetical protein
VTAPERVLYGLAYWARRGESDMVGQLARSLSDPERAEAQAVLGLPGVAETLRELPEDELRARMLALAGKSKETPVKANKAEITTILPGDRGIPPVVLREPGWQQQADAEREAQQRAETKAEVERIEREAAIRKTARPAPLVSRDPVQRVHDDWRREKWLAAAAESRDLPRRQAELEEWARKVELERAMEPPAPPPPVRHGRPLSTAELNYEAAQADYQAKRARPPGGGCGYCNTCRDGGGQWCLFS